MPTLTAPLQDITDDLIVDDIATENTTPWIVWWHIGIYKNRQAYSEPKVHVAFYQLSGNTLTGRPILRSIPLTLLGRMRVGTVWLHGRLTQTAQFEERTFTINFGKDHWRFTSCSNPHHGRTPYPDALHPFWDGKNDSWLIELDLPRDGHLIIPCLEIFTRLYGRSQEIKRVLATYPWDGIDEQAEARLLPSTDEPEEPGLWKIKLPDRLIKGDALLLAHLKYDERAQRAARDIYAQLEAGYSLKSKRPIFIQVPPWFHGQAQIKVRGYPFGKSFLGLQIVGCSEPSGMPIVCIKHGVELVSQSEEQRPGARNNQPTPQTTQPALITHVTGNTEPDRDATTRTLTEDEFETLGEPRQLAHIRVSKQRRILEESTIRGAHGTQIKEAAISGAEPFGSGKDTQHGLIHAPQAMESQGALRDIWNALRERQKRLPNQVTELTWYTFATGFQASPEPQLITLRPIHNERIETSVRHWVYSNTKTKALRGVLVIRVCIDGQATFFVEIQRRPRTVTDDRGKVAASEENFRGLVFRLDNPTDLHHWLHRFLSDIRFEKGIVSRLIHKCPGPAGAFSHTISQKDDYLFESTLDNALRKLDLPHSLHPPA